jgi:hypothetical protein
MSRSKTQTAPSTKSGQQLALGSAPSVRRPKENAPLAEAVRHPIRVRILEVLNERDMSPTDFVKAGYADFYFGHRPDVSHIAYHFRELAGFGCLEAIDWRRGGGSIATIYRGVARGEFVGDDWAALSNEEQRGRSRAVAQGLIARIDSALMAETFNSRVDRQISWFAMQLDERGWDDLASMFADTFANVDRIRNEAEDRLKESDEPGMTATAGILVFESPVLDDPAMPPTRGS